MVKSHEDAYWPDNLSLFTVNCEHYREPKKQNYGKSGLYGLYPCRGSPVKQFLFYRVSRKIAKIAIFGAPNSNL